VTTAAGVFFPLDEQLALRDKHWTASLAKSAVWLSGVVGSFEEAAAVLLRIGQIDLPKTSVWRRVAPWGAEFQAYDEACGARATQLRSRSEFITPVRGGSQEKMGVAMDGGMVHLLEEGWKELKVGCVYQIEPQAIRDPETGEWLNLGHARQSSYVAHLGGPAVFGQQVWAEAKRRGWEKVYDSQVMGDGARWIWKVSAEHFYDSHQTVDWYHGCQHLHLAAQLCHPDDPVAARRWYRTAETTLFQGHADRIALDLHQKAAGHPQNAKSLHTEAGYFETNKRRMQYLELREEGYPIGSGMIESGVKQFKARFTGPGMRWSRAGLQRLVPIRATILSQKFDATWDSIYNSPKN
jgi:hypothetical protein